jgi:polyisoprenoid-binding protein YceI
MAAHRCGSFPAILLLFAAWAAWGAQWRMLPERSLLGFSPTLEGEVFEGRFVRFSADIRFDPQNLEQCEFRVTVDLASADTGSQERDRALTEPVWFDVTRYPRAEYHARAFRRVETDRFEADGELSLKGVRRAVPIQFRWSETAAAATLVGQARIRRTEFGVGMGEWAQDPTVGFEVPIHFELALERI